MECLYCKEGFNPSTTKPVGDKYYPYRGIIWSTRHGRLLLAVLECGCKFTQGSWAVCVHVCVAYLDIPSGKGSDTWRAGGDYQHALGTWPCSVSYCQGSWAHGPPSVIPLFKLHSGKTRATCLSGTFWAPVSKFQLSRHVGDMISTREQISLNPQGIWVTRTQNEKQTWLQVPSVLFLENELKGVFDFNMKFGTELVHKAV